MTKVQLERETITAAELTVDVLGCTISIPSLTYDFVDGGVLTRFMQTQNATVLVYQPKDDNSRSVTISHDDKIIVYRGN